MAFEKAGGRLAGAGGRRLLGRVVLSAAVFASILSCDDWMGTDGDNRLGVIAFFGDPVVVSVPDTVFAGESFTVSVRTYGGGCVSEGGTKVKIDSLSVDVTPYDIHRGRVCADVLNMFDHTASVTLDYPGDAQIIIHGMQMPDDIPIAEVRELVVR
jgi:hypothetical protein